MGGGRYHAPSLVMVESHFSPPTMTAPRGGSTRGVRGGQEVEGRLQPFAGGLRHRYDRILRRLHGMERREARLGGDFGDRQSDGLGRVDQFGCGEAKPGMPYRGIDDKNEPFACHVRQPAMRRQGRRQAGAKLLFQGVEPHGTTHRVGSGIRQGSLQGRLRGAGTARLGLRIRHRYL